MEDAPYGAVLGRGRGFGLSVHYGALSVLFRKKRQAALEANYRKSAIAVTGV